MKKIKQTTTIQKTCVVCKGIKSKIEFNLNQQKCKTCEELKLYKCYKCQTIKNYGDFDKDIQTLLRKEAAGASFATTQFFFEVDKWKALVDDLAKHGSTLPIIAGILPVTNVNQLNRMSELGGTPIPASIASAFDALKDKPDDVRKLGVDLATKLCEDLLEAGVPGLHFYTMNTSTATQEIFAQIKDKKRS